MVDALDVPVGLQHFALFVELHDAAGVDVGKQPLVDGQALAHAPAEARHPPGEIERRRAHADDGEPVIAVGSEVDVVREARKVIHDDLDLPLLRAVEPVALDRAAEGFREQDRLAVAGDADAVGEFQAAQHGACGVGAGVVADDAAVAARFQPVHRPLVHLVAHRRLGEEDPAVIGDIEVVGEPETAVVVDGIDAAVGLVGRLFDLAVRGDAIEPHAADANIEVVLAIEGHAERLAADMGVHLHLLVIGRKEADDVAVARSRIEIVVAVEDDVLRRLDAAEPDQRDVAQLVVLLERAALADLGRRWRRQPVIGRRDIDLADDARPVLQPPDVDDGGEQQDAGQHHAVEPAPDRHRGQAVGDEQHDQRSGRGLGDRSLAAAERDAAEHGRGQDRHLEADADIAADRAEPGREKQRTRRGQDATGDIAKRDGPPDGNAGIIGRAARAADRRDMPARAQPRQEDVAEDRDREIKDGDAGNAEHIAAADEIPGRKVRKGRRDLGRIAEQQQIVGRAVDDQRDQGRDERA